MLPYLWYDQDPDRKSMGKKFPGRGISYMRMYPQEPDHDAPDRAEQHGLIFS